jgi:hypothetical protein
VIRRRSALPALALVAALIAACSAPPASGGPAVVASGPSPTPTLNPNQLEELRRSLGITPEPQPVTTPTGAIDGSQPPAPPPSPFAPDLEAMLPSTVGGVPLQRFSAPAALYDTGGDICALLCPGEPTRLAEAAGVPIEEVSVAVAFPPRDSTLRSGVIAIRFDGLDTKRSPVDVRLKAGGHIASAAAAGLPPEVKQLKVGPRTITWVTWPPMYDASQGEYLLSNGNVLFIVVGTPPDKAGKVPDDVRAMVEALPST